MNRVVNLAVAMSLSPAFKTKVATSWGAVGAALAAILAWLVSLFAGAPPSLPM